MNSTLSLNLVNEGIVRNYWLNIEPVPVVNSMSVADAAALIDETFQVDSCDEEYDPWGHEHAEPEIPTADDFDVATGILDIPSCDTDTTVSVKIFVAYPEEDEAYTIRLSNGRVVENLRFRESVTHIITVTDANSVTLDNPIVANLEMSWQNISSAPELQVEENTIFWDGPFTGTIKAEFDTIYDLVTVRIDELEENTSVELFGTYPGSSWTAADGEEDLAASQCEMLVFYHYQYFGEVLTAPDLENAVNSDVSLAICNNNYGGSLDVEDGEEERRENCIENCVSLCADDGGSEEKADCVAERGKCLADCAGDPSCEADCYDTFNTCYAAAEPLPDPDCVTACEDECSRDCFGRKNAIEICHCNTGSVVHNEALYPVDCTAQEDTGAIREQDAENIVYNDCGGRDEVFDRDHYAEICPEEPDPVTSGLEVIGYEELDLSPNNLPWCVSMTRALEPDSDPDAATKAELEEKYTNISFAGVGPADSNVCGEFVVEQLSPCDDDAPDMSMDQEPVYVAPGDDVTLYAVGGTAPYTWKLPAGKHFVFANSRYEITTTEPSTAVYADFDACGSIEVEVVDQCAKTASVAVLSITGEWKRTIVYNAGCGSYCSCYDGAMFASNYGCEDHDAYQESCQEYRYIGNMRYYSHTGSESFDDLSTAERLRAESCTTAFESLEGVCSPHGIVDYCMSSNGSPIYGVDRLREYQAHIWACPDDDVEWVYLPDPA